MPSPESAPTPMFQQYHRAKAEHPDAILMFRMGDFYEMFFQDAVTASQVLEITLTARQGGADLEVPMCGVPVHAADGYIARLVAGGHRVAICEQVEDPRSARGLVRREVVRVVTPGTLTDPDHLVSKDNHYLAGLWADADGTGTAYLDLSTGDFRLAEAAGASAWSRLVDQAATFAPRELVVPEGAAWLERLAGSPLEGVPRRAQPGWTFDEETARRTLTEQLRAHSLDGFGVADLRRAVRAAGALLHYLRETQKSEVAHIDRVVRHDDDDHMLLDDATLRSLEVVRAASGGTAATLLAVLDHTQTAMGGRLLRRWLLQPLRRRDEAVDRHAAVQELLARAADREAARREMQGVLDLERLLGRVALGSATPRDLGGIRDSLERLPALRGRLQECTAPLLARVAEEMDDLADLAARLRAALPDRPPLASREGGILRDGFHPEVDEVRTLSRDAREILAQMESRERQRTGITSLKIRFNKVFGYYIEVSRPNLPHVPEDYQRKQTLANAERFITPELKDTETRILNARDRLAELEHEAFLELRHEVAAAAGRIRASAAAVAAADALLSLAEAAERRGYVRPRFLDHRRLRLVEARHPVVEALGPTGRFVPNDLELDGATRQIVILTGPNMGGKSTYLRQTALIALMAQAGSFVPAREAELPLFDRIFSRVGASDNLAGGQSTFLVEMQETANILHGATDHSLVILDEVGRGTSTFDGLSLAWAVVEQLHERPDRRPLTLFATHYHELTELPVTLPRAANLNIAVREWNGEIVFLRRVVEGAADQSYGIHVAQLAGVPSEVLERAREVLRNLEGGEFTREGLPRIARSARPGAPEGTRQMRLFAEEDPALQQVRTRLEQSEPERMTPLEALSLLAELRRLLRGGGS